MATNPFETRYIRPSSIEFVPNGCDPITLSQQISQTKGPFQIVGPHGSGKTTLTFEIAKHLLDLGIGARWITLRKQGRFRLPSVLHPTTPASAGSADTKSQVIFVDGIETLTILNRAIMLKSNSPANKIVVTTHRALYGVKQLFKTESTLAHFKMICEKLIGHIDDSWESKIKAAFQNHGANIREALFELYDVFESQQQRSTAN